MVEVTRIVNARPISTVPSDVEQPQPLTPSMLLTMKTKPLVSPSGVFTREDLYSRKYWKRAQYLSDQFVLDVEMNIYRTNKEDQNRTNANTS